MLLIVVNFADRLKIRPSAIVRGPFAYDSTSVAVEQKYVYLIIQLMSASDSPPFPADSVTPGETPAPRQSPQAAIDRFSVAQRTSPSAETTAGRQPLYARIQHYVRQEIASGRLHDGDQIPTEADLCEQFQAARATVARAIQQLAYEGLIVRRPGSGSFVSVRAISTPLHLEQVTSFEDKLAGENGRIEYEVLGFAMRAATASENAALQLPPGEKVLELRRLRLVEEQRTSLEIRVMPLHIGRAMTVDMLHTRSIHRMLDELGHPVRKVVGKIRASIADHATAEHLDVPTGSALLIRDYTLHDQAGEAIVCGESYYRAEYHIDYQVKETH